MKKNKRLKLTTIQSLTHYGIVILLLFITSITGWHLIEIYLTNTYTGVRSADELIRSSLPFLLLAVLFAVIQHRRLKFKEVNVTFTDNQFQEAVERTVKDLEWRIDNKQALKYNLTNLNKSGREIIKRIESYKQ